MPRKPWLLIGPVSSLTFFLDDYWALTSDLISARMIIRSGLLLSTLEYPRPSNECLEAKLSYSNSLLINSWLHYWAHLASLLYYSTHIWTFVRLRTLLFQPKLNRHKAFIFAFIFFHIPPNITILQCCVCRQHIDCGLCREQEIQYLFSLPIVTA